MPPIRLTIITASPQPRDLAVPEPRAGRIPAEMPCACGFLRPGKPGGRTFDRVGPPPVPRGTERRDVAGHRNTLEEIVGSRTPRHHGHGRETHRSDCTPSLIAKGCPEAARPGRR